MKVQVGALNPPPEDEKEEEYYDEEEDYDEEADTIQKIKSVGNSIEDTFRSMSSMQKV